MKKVFYAIFALLAVASAACTSAPATDDIVDRPVKEFHLTGNEFAWDPATITVNEGDHVILHITSTDVEHGIGIPEFGVNAAAPVGETVTVEFDATKKGTFKFFCNVYCGQGHRNMTGQLIVE